MHFFCWLFPHIPVWYVPGLQGALHSTTDTVVTDTVQILHRYSRTLT